MKANAPKKIYLQVCGDCNDNDCENCKFEDLEDNVTWAKERIFEKDVEYTCIDAFIEKAVDFFEEYLIEEDCKFGHVEWKELSSKFETIDDFIRAFKNFINNK